MIKKIDSFRGDYRFLSNFWPAQVSFEEKEYDCVEKAYVAAKFDKDLIISVKTDFGMNPVHVRGFVANIETAGKVKRFGQKHKAHIRSDWNEVKLEVMRQLVAEKFSEKNPELVKLLLKTGDAEQTPQKVSPQVFPSISGEIGQNHLGKLLMARRAQILILINGEGSID